MKILRRPHRLVFAFLLLALLGAVQPAALLASDAPAGVPTVDEFLSSLDANPPVFEQSGGTCPDCLPGYCCAPNQIHCKRCAVASEPAQTTPPAFLATGSQCDPAKGATTR